MMSAAFTVRCPAKINLFLDVVSRRPDGYHEIRTVFLPVDAPADTLVVEPLPAPGLDVRCEHPGVPLDRRNLCWRAAEAFAAAVGRDPAWRIAIDKQTPVAGGMGGGSSDAGCLLRALNDAAGAPVAASDLARIARGLGADVPFFLDPRPALGTGIGDVLTPLAMAAALPLVLVSPGFPAPAAWAYGNLSRVPRPPAPDLDTLVATMARGDVSGMAAGSYNALEYALLDKFPLLKMLCDALREAGCLAAHVSGSGPTVYGICPVAEPHAIAATVRRRFPQFWVRTARAVTA